MEIRNSAAIVTGASHGIGRALAQQLGGRGARVALVARSKDELEALAAELPGAIAIAADLGKADDIRRLVAETKKAFGRIDLLVNNAGQGLRSPLEKTSVDDYRAIIELNVVAPLIAMQEVMPLMRAQGDGIILNISSMVSKNYIPNLAGYASTKYALNALSLTARQELAPDNIRVCVFYPRMTATDFGQHARGETYVSGAGRPGMTVDTPEEVAKKIIEQIESEEAEAEM
ncbi:MAG: SDR family NAD(P)-dependent oxidoreductase [Minisyncoccia bacterium]